MVLSIWEEPAGFETIAPRIRDWVKEHLGAHMTSEPVRQSGRVVVNAERE